MMEIYVEGEHKNFPLRPDGIPSDYHGIALHVSPFELKSIIEWILEEEVWDRGLIVDANGYACNYTGDDWKIMLGSRACEVSPWQHIRDRTLRCYFADVRDAVAFRLRLG